MKISNLSRNSGSSPLLFCLGMFFVALFFSVFVCSAIYYAVRTDNSAPKEQLVKQPAKKQDPVLASIMK